jgi:Outer membrane protein beta-barrel domain
MNRSVYVLCFAALLLTMVASQTRAQQKFEITPFVGYETSGSYPVNSFYGSLGTAQPPVNSFRVNGSLAFGTFLDYNLTENTQLEFLWNRNNTSYSAQSSLTNQYYKAFDSNVDQFQFGGLYMFMSSEHRLRPYIAAGLGFTHDANDGGNANRTEFAYNLGGGVKYYASRHIGFRGDARWMPTYGSSTNGVYCDPFYGCYNARVWNYLNRGSFTAGLIIHF